MPMLIAKEEWAGGRGERKSAALLLLPALARNLPCPCPWSLVLGPWALRVHLVRRSVCGAYQNTRTLAARPAQQNTECSLGGCPRPRT
eukprot:scaffold292619_cov39-Tisochrysis_lutea.AAC.1